MNSKLKVLLVARETDTHSYKGFTRYTLELYKELQNLCDVELLTVFLNESNSRYSKELQAFIPLQAAFKANPRRIRNYDVIHALDPFLGAFLPLFSSKLVVTFHDIVPLTLKGKWRFERFVQFYHRMIYSLAARSNRIIASSTQTKKEMIDILHVDKNKVHIVSSGGVDIKFQPTNNDHVRDIPIVGFFGNFCQRKRVDLAIETYRKILDRGTQCKLVLAGGNIKEPSKTRFNVDEMIKGLGDVKQLDFIPEDEIVNLYNSFDVLLYPSDTEGFGLHIPEAQACGIPVVVREKAKIPEEVKHAAVQCNTVDDMADACIKLLKQPEYYKEVSDLGRDYVKLFNWWNIAEQTLKVYEQIIKGTDK